MRFPTTVLRVVTLGRALVASFALTVVVCAHTTVVTLRGGPPPPAADNDDGDYSQHAPSTGAMYFGGSGDGAQGTETFGERPPCPAARLIS